MGHQGGIFNRTKGAGRMRNKEKEILLKGGTILDPSRNIKKKGENATHTPVKFAWQAERPGSTHEAKSFTETHLLELWRSH